MLAELNEANILKIESHVQKNQNIVIGTEYEERIANFEFLPGHRAFLLSLPEKVKKITQFKTIENTTATVNETENARGNDEAHVLKSKLLKKLLTFAQKNKFILNLTIDSVVDFRKDSEHFKCKIVCPECNKHLSCIHKSYWLVSNAQNHFYKHHFPVKPVSQTESINIDSVRDPLFIASPTQANQNLKSASHEVQEFFEEIEYIVEDDVTSDVNFGDENQTEINCLLQLSDC